VLAIYRSFWNFQNRVTPALAALLPAVRRLASLAAPSRSFPKTLRVENYESSVRTRSRRSAESERSNTVKDGSSPIDGVCSRKRLRKAKRGPPSKEAMLIVQPSQLADTLHRG
jgi:hypothetical protein